VQVVFLHPDLSRLAYLSRIDLTISEILKSPESLQSYVILHRAEKACYLPGWQINNFLGGLGSILLIHSKVVLVYGRTAAKVYLLLGLVALVGGNGAQQSCFWV